MGIHPIISRKFVRVKQNPVNLWKKVRGLMNRRVVSTWYTRVQYLLLCGQKVKRMWSEALASKPSRPL